MIVDLNNSSEYDKQIIYLDSRNGIFPNKNEFSFNIKFDEKIKNLTSVKIIETSLVLNGKLGLKWEYVGTTAPIAKIFYIKVLSSKFVVNGELNPVLLLFRGGNYIFDQSDVSNLNHPLSFNNDDFNLYTSGVTISGVPGTEGAKTVITVAFDSPDILLYYCTVHGINMGNNINISLQTAEANIEKESQNIKINNVELSSIIDYANTQITPKQFTNFNLEEITEKKYIELVPGLMWNNVGFSQPYGNTTEYVNANLNAKLLEKYCANDTIINLTRAEYNSYIIGNAVPIATDCVKLITGLFWEKSTTINTAPGATLIKTLDRGNALRNTFLNASDTTNIAITKEQLQSITTSNLVSGNYISIPINDNASDTHYYIPRLIYLTTAILYFKPVRRISYNSIFYIELNNYDRVHSYINKYNSCNTVVNYNTVKYFDTLHYNGTTESSLVLYNIKNYYSLASSNWTDPTVYILNPPETSCNRFTVTIRDKDFKILRFGDYLDEESFNMTICVYTIKKNIYG